MKQNIENSLYKIAAFNSWDIEKRGDLKEHESEAENRIELSIADLRAMLNQIFELGQETAELERKQNQELKNQIFRQATKAYRASHPEAR